MQHRRLLLVSALVVAALPAFSPPAKAQDPRRIFGPLAAPFGMILRGMPRARAPRARRAPRAVNRRPTIRREAPAVVRTRPEPRRTVAAAGAAGAIAFWPIAAPGAFEDMVGYALWPREYGRQFWSHGPRDIMQAMTAPTAAFASADGTAGRLPSVVGAANASGAGHALCIARVNENAVRPLDRVAEAITLNPEQAKKLAHLRTAVRTAIEAEAAACRSDIPGTQPERLRAMIDGLWAMRYAEFRIRPALEAFYSSLDEAQKAQLADEPQTVGSTAEAAASNSPAAACSGTVAAQSNPFAPVQRTLRPTAEQRESLQMLYGASMEMAQFLTSTCPGDTPATPMARLDAAGDRIISLLHAAMNIEPMLKEFYGQLSDQQRRRFNTVAR
jgi:hypothetical protein